MVLDNRTKSTMPKILEGTSNSMTVDTKLAHELLFHPSHDLWDIKNWYSF